MRIGTKVIQLEAIASHVVDELSIAFPIAEAEIGQPGGEVGAACPG